MYSIDGKPIEHGMRSNLEFVDGSFSDEKQKHLKSMLLPIASADEKEGVRDIDVLRRKEKQQAGRPRRRRKLSRI